MHKTHSFFFSAFTTKIYICFSISHKRSILFRWFFCFRFDPTNSLFFSLFAFIITFLFFLVGKTTNITYLFAASSLPCIAVCFCLYHIDTNNEAHSIIILQFKAYMPSAPLKKNGRCFGSLLMLILLLSFITIVYFSFHRWFNMFGALSSCHTHMNRTYKYNQYASVFRLKKASFIRNGTVAFLFIFCIPSVIYSVINAPFM